MPTRVPCVGALIHDKAGRLLLVQRAHPPSEGLWSIPGGRVEAGEDGPAAVQREVREETGLEVSVGALVGSVERPGPDDTVYVIDDYAATVVGGHLRPGDDARAARWVDKDDLARLPLTPGLLDALTEWNQVPH